MAHENADSIPEAVAVIGMSGRFPGARDLDQYWHNLSNGVESVTRFTDEELVAAGFDPALLDAPDRVKAGAILDDIDQFDASFFGITPREADAMDPQQRFFLECSWEALENAGYDPQGCPPQTAVFGGCSMSTYHLHGLRVGRQDTKSMGSSQVNAGSSTDFLTMRVSYLLNLKGPSITLHTACSTSLVAVVQAWQALMSYQCDLALAGGATIRVPQKSSYSVEKEAILSADGHCRTFDAKAAGTVSGEGAGVVVLKRLEDAIADGDNVRAVLRGAGINNEGYDKVSIYAPSVNGQAEVIAMALALADVDPNTITYVEAHGTGTSLGDPIEVAALTQAFRAHTDKKGFCAIGSVKSNFGHAEAGAGIAGLIKTVLAIEHKQLPPSLNFETPNPAIDFENSPFYVNTKLTDWRPSGHPRRAGVSSFGLGGTNAHVIAEDPPPMADPPATRKTQLLTLSAKTEPALEEATDRLARHLRDHPDVDLADVAYTLQTGRGLFGHRRTLTCEDAASAVEALEAKDQRIATTVQEAGVRPVVFMFPGQGAQYIHMGRGLYDTEPVFRAEVDACCEILGPHLELDLRTLLYPTENEEQAAEQLGQTRYTQPALFVIEYALSKLYMSWGIQPAALVGHSNGESVAGCLASVFSLEDALQLVATRARLMQARPTGDMLSIPMPEEKVRALLGDELSLAAVNGPSSCVVSGPSEAVAALNTSLDERDVVCRVLHTSHAFHSTMMEPVAEPLLEVLGGMKLSPAKIDCVSTVTGKWNEPETMTDPQYWIDNLLGTVRFNDAASALVEDADRILLEVGPGRALTTLVRQQRKNASKRTVVQSMRHPTEEISDAATAIGTLGRMWMAGAAVDWSGFHGGVKRRRVPLPTYPFQRKRHWMSEAPVGAQAGQAAGAITRRADVADWFWAPSWRRTPSPAAATEPAEGGWLVLCDDVGVGEQVAQRLAGSQVVTARCGEGFRKTGDRSFEIDPTSRSDHDALLDAVVTEVGVPRQIIHACSVVAAEGEPMALDALDSSQGRGFHSVLYLIQALGERLGDQTAHLQVVCNDLFEVTGREARRPDRATVLGPCRVAPQEYEGLTCGVIDVQLPSEGQPWAHVIEPILAEVSQLGADPVTAYRGPHRWIPSYEAAPLEAAPADATWRDGDGAVLITGGLGGIGLEIAGMLAECPGTKLVLVGRSGLPERDQWATWLDDHDEADRTGRRIRAVQALEERGAECMVASASVADLDAMREVVQQAKQKFGAIRGVVHAAGAATGGMIALRTAAEAAEVLDPKVKGTLVLRELLRDEPLGFFALCSALAAVQPAVGAADYCGANSFLDAVVHSDEGRSTPFVTLGWDAWAEVGMAAETDVPEAMRAARDQQLAQGIQPPEGVDAFARALSSPLRQVYVSTRDLPARLAAAAGTKVSDYTDEDGPEPAAAEGPAATSSGHERPDLPNPYAAPEGELETSIAAVVEEILGMDRVGRNDNLFELGFDSLLSYMMIARLKKQHGVEPPLRIVLEQPTVAELAKYVEAALWAASQMSDPG